HPFIYPQYRKIKLEIFKKINNTSKFNTIRIRKITTIVRKEFLNSIYTRTNIYNAQAHIYRRNLDSYTPTSALIKSFNNNGIKYIKKINPNNNERLLGLIFTFPACIEIARIFLKIIITNNTYNTNRFYYPFY
ncbi:hypothetical protein QR685DRAFT_451517, partial [Neurospora intermedia]